jgi:hypothetical protein
VCARTLTPTLPTATRLALAHLLLALGDMRAALDEFAQLEQVRSVMQCVCGTHCVVSALTAHARAQSSTGAAASALPAVVGSASARLAIARTYGSLREIVREWEESVHSCLYSALWRTRPRTALAANGTGRTAGACAPCEECVRAVWSVYVTSMRCTGDGGAIYDGTTGERCVHCA